MYAVFCVCVCVYFGWKKHKSCVLVVNLGVCLLRTYLVKGLFVTCVVNCRKEFRWITIHHNSYLWLAFNWIYRLLSYKYYAVHTSTQLFNYGYIFCFVSHQNIFAPYAAINSVGEMLTHFISSHLYLWHRASFISPFPVIILQHEIILPMHEHSCDFCILSIV